MITFIVPSYNQGEYIKYTLDSILAIMDDEDQLIIADGASKDGTADVVRSYLSDPRIEWYSEPDRGFSDAMTKALKRVRNPIVGIMSSDDAYKPGIRARALAPFRDPGVVLVYADYDIIDTANKTIGEFRHKNGSLEDIMSLRVILPQSSVFFRRAALKFRDILNLEHDYVADVVLFNQVCMAGSFVHVPEIWSEVRKHGGSRSGKRDPGLQYLHAVETVFNSLPVETKEKARAAALLLRSRHLATLNQRVKAVRHLIAAFALDPALVNHWLLGRTVAYIVLGATGINLLQLIRTRWWSWAKPATDHAVRQSVRLS